MQGWASLRRVLDPSGGPGGLLPVHGSELPLSKPDRLRRDLDQLVLIERADLLADVHGALPRHQAIFVTSDAGPVHDEAGASHRQDFGVAFQGPFLGIGQIGDEVGISIAIEAVRQ